MASSKKILIWLSAIFLVSLGACKKEDFDLIPYPEQSLDIKRIELSCPFYPQMKQFWTQNLGLAPVDSGSNYFTVEVGRSRIRFNRVDNLNPPFYHFAILIPENQIEGAYEWISKRGVTIYKEENKKSEIIHKPKFNTQSVYFRDPAGNVVELAARRDLKNTQTGEFTTKMLLGIVDVSLVLRDTWAAEQAISENLNVKRFERSTSGFIPIGGINGNVTVIVSGKPIPPVDTRKSFPYRTVVVLRHPQQVSIDIETNIRIRTEP